MSFRVRRGWWSGNAILQVSEGTKWTDAFITEDLEKGFHIVGLSYMQAMEEELGMLRAELDAIKETRSDAAKRGWLKKRAPLLNQSIYTTRKPLE